MAFVLHLAESDDRTIMDQINSNLHSMDAEQLVIAIKDSEQQIEKNVEQLKRLESQLNDLLSCNDKDDVAALVIPECETEAENTREWERLAKEQEQTLIASKYSLNKCEEHLRYLPSQCASYVGIHENTQLIRVGDMEPKLVACMNVDNELYMIVQRRLDGSVNFNRSWTEYREGFGDLNGEFFIGLNMLHQLTRRRQHKLLILLTDENNWSLKARYNNFVVGGESKGYELKELGTFDGNVGDALSYNKGMKFSTYDNDNDKIRKNCGSTYNGWWHNQCTYWYPTHY